MTAEDYVGKYHGLVVPDFSLSGSKLVGVGTIRTPVDEYCNRLHSNRYGKSHSERWGLKETLMKFCAAQAPNPDSPLFAVGGGYSLASSIPPLAYVDKDMVESCFYGKASPEKLWACIHLLSFWRGWRKYKEGAAVATVDEIVDKYLGMDCNGFVGNYLKAKYAAFHLGPSTPEEDYFYNRGAVRSACDEIKPDDVVLILRESADAVDWSADPLADELKKKRFGIGHIAVVSRVLSASRERAEVVLSESKTSHSVNGGPQSNTWTIKRLGPMQFDIVNRSRVVHSIVRVKTI